MEKVIKIARFTYIKTSIILLLLSICFHTYSQKETYSIKRKILLISIHDRDMRLEKFLANKHYRKTSRALNDELSELVFHDAVYHLKTNLKDLHFWGDTIIGYIWDSQEAGVKIHIVVPQHLMFSRTKNNLGNAKFKRCPMQLKPLFQWCPDIIL